MNREGYFSKPEAFLSWLDTLNLLLQNHSLPFLPCAVPWEAAPHTRFCGSLFPGVHLGHSMGWQQELEGGKRKRLECYPPGSLPASCFGSGCDLLPKALASRKAGLSYSENSYEVPTDSPFPCFFRTGVVMAFCCC